MKTPSKDFTLRYAAAKKWRDKIRPDIELVYKYCDPERQKDFRVDPYRWSADYDQESEVFISIAEEMATDFAGDLVNYYVPQEQVWSSFTVTTPVNEAIADEVQAIVQQREEDIFEYIEASNFNDVAPQVMFEATHGTIAMWVDAAHLTRPLHFECVPPNELMLIPGHLGILDRFREKHVPADTIPALFGADETVDISHRNIQSKIKKPGSFCKVSWGFWVDWSDPAIPRWKREILIDDKCVSPPQIIGPLAGACPLQVGRFNPKPGRPWGRGPARKALPDILTLDKVEEVVLTKLDAALDPAYSGVDDGILDASGGIQAGMFYPRRAGSDAPEPIQSAADLDYGFYSKQELEDRIRAAFYQDGPRQRGDTPPTATQWSDERRRIQQRLGKPSAPIWTEFLLPTIQRVEFLLAQLGLIEGAITLNETQLTLLPVSPLTRAQNQDQVMIARSNIGLAMEAFGPEGAMQVIDTNATFGNVVEASGDKLTKIRQQEPQVEAATPADG